MKRLVSDDGRTPMLLCAAGDIHGAIGRLYDDVLAFESALGRRFEWVLHVGDFGVWPDPDRVDKATRKHEGAGDFPSWFAERRAVPRKTIFIKGNHEDFVWLDSRDREESAASGFVLGARAARRRGALRSCLSFAKSRSDVVGTAGDAKKRRDRGGRGGA